MRLNKNYLKKRAKRLREQFDCHGHALDHVSREFGYMSWNHFCGALDATENALARKIPPDIQEKYWRPEAQSHEPT